MLLLEICFWLSVGVVIYIYLGYPLVARLLAGLKRSDSQCSGGGTPSVTVLIAAFNEEDKIGETVRNKLEQEYPPELLDVVVVSDASEDNTDQIVSSFDERVTLIRQEQRAGKTAALNLGMQNARGEIIVFADANSIFSTQAIRHLATKFADPEVGYVTGRMVYVSSEGSLIGDGCTAYMRYENWLRTQESIIGSVIGVDGGIDAIRAELFTRMLIDQQSDFVQPLMVARKGYRVRFEPQAELREHSLSDQSSEYQMRVRVSLRALWVLWYMRDVMNLLNYRVLAWQLISHKLLRYLAWAPLLLAFFSGLALMGQSPLYTVLFVLQALFYLIGGVGLLLAGSGSSWLTIPYYFLVLNIASAHAFFKFALGEKKAIWTPRVG